MNHIEHTGAINTAPTLQIGDHDQRSQHPETAKVFHDFAIFTYKKGDRDEAAILYQCALAMREQVFGPKHSTTATTRTAYIQLLREMGRIDEATIIETQVAGETISH